MPCAPALIEDRCLSLYGTLVLTCGLRTCACVVMQLQARGSAIAGSVSFRRVSLRPNQCPAWAKSNKPFLGGAPRGRGRGRPAAAAAAAAADTSGGGSGFRVLAHGAIEEQSGCLQVDFANKCASAHVLRDRARTSHRRTCAPAFAELEPRTLVTGKKAVPVSRISRPLFLYSFCAGGGSYFTQQNEESGLDPEF